MKILPLLKAMKTHNASDLYLTVDAHATIKIVGKHLQLSHNKLQQKTNLAFIKELLNAEELSVFETKKEFNKGISFKDIGRFRFNFFYQRGCISIVIRYINDNIASPASLGIPSKIQDSILEKDGLILFVGATGSGKSTSMASLINYRNKRMAGHILTVEDPIEFNFEHHRSIINQREIGIDTLNYANALREALREAPDLIMVGEARDTETMKAVLDFADSGHLAISTLHANNTTQALERILYFYPSEQKKRILMDLSLNIKAIVAQRLIPSVNQSFTLATEVLINTPLISEKIRLGKLNELHAIIAKGAADGMHTFDQSIMHSVVAGMLSKDTALKYAGSKNNLEWEMNFNGNLTLPN